MAHETFENSTIANLLNKNFVNIKVDREERPDIDAIYMLALQIMTGTSGCPASLFLTPELKPFYAGTYFPPHRRGSEVGFDEIILAVTDTWQNRRGEALKYSREITEAVCRWSSGPTVPPAHLNPATDKAISEDQPSNLMPMQSTSNSCKVDEVPSSRIVDLAVEKLQAEVDTFRGGFGDAPKFPEATSLELLLRYGHRSGQPQHWEAVRLTLLAMCRGGVYDVLEGGFARYSVDNNWLIPHFEKMLCDNALLSSLYIDAFRVCGESTFARVATETLNYICDSLSDTDGGLCSSVDADSLDDHDELEEGAYYTWKLTEIQRILGNQSDIFCFRYGVTEEGNHAGSNVLFAAHGVESVAEAFDIPVLKVESMLAECRQKLLDARRLRKAPKKDEKVLVSWNAMAINALAVGGRVFDEPKFSAVAERIADFIWNSMRDRKSGLLHSWFHGKAHLPAYADDYACLIGAYVTMYETTGRARWIGRACRLAEEMLEKFEDRERGGLFYTANQSDALIARTKEWHDASTPASNGVAALSLTRLGRCALRDDFLQAAKRILAASAGIIARQSRTCSKLLSALEYWHHGGQQWIFSAASSDSLRPFAKQFFSIYRPNTGVAWVIGNAPDVGPLASLLRDRPPAGENVTFYECTGEHCGPPVTDESLLLQKLTGQR